MSIDSRIGSSSSRCFTRKITPSFPSRAILFDDINKTVFCFSLYDPSKLAKIYIFQFALPMYCSFSGIS